MQMNEHDAYIALNMMEKVGPVGVRALVTVLGSATAIFEADKDVMMRANGIGPEVAHSIIDQRDAVDWRGELERASTKGAHIITPIDREYPKSLREIHDPPLSLYVWGRLEDRDGHSIAVVGTRRPTHYGRESAERLAYQLAKTGFVVVSGLARGFDTAAHQGALKAKGRTLAVIGSALDCLYPASNAALAQRISEHGAVITEFPFGKHPDKTTFPMRNRIISGLSMGVLVVEADMKSGALITTDQALEQGRSVFAMPGRVDSSASRGAHQLIKNGARLVTTVDDILDEYEFLIPRRRDPTGNRRGPGPELSDDESCLMVLLKNGEQDVDSLIRASGLKPSVVSASLIGLEMKKVIRMLPGRMVEMRN